MNIWIKLTRDEEFEWAIEYCPNKRCLRLPIRLILAILRDFYRRSINVIQHFGISILQSLRLPPANQEKKTHFSSSFCSKSSEISSWPIHPYDLRKIFPVQIIVRFEEDFTQSRLANRIVFGIELIETMKCVTILVEKYWTRIIWLEKMWTIFFGAKRNFSQEFECLQHVRRAYQPLSHRLLNSSTGKRQTMSSGYLQIFTFFNRTRFCWVRTSKFDYNCTFSQCYHFVSVIFQCFLNKTQQMLLIHTGCSMNVRIHFAVNKLKWSSIFPFPNISSVIHIQRKSV